MLLPRNILDKYIRIHIHVYQSQTHLDLFWFTVGIPSTDIENLIFAPFYVFSLRHINRNAILEYLISYHILA